MNRFKILSSMLIWKSFLKRHVMDGPIEEKVHGFEWNFDHFKLHVMQHFYNSVNNCTGEIIQSVVLTADIFSWWLAQFIWFQKNTLIIMLNSIFLLIFVIGVVQNEVCCFHNSVIFFNTHPAICTSVEIRCSIIYSLRNNLWSEEGMSSFWRSFCHVSEL